MLGEFTSQGEVRSVYRRRARNYDVTANLYYLLGFREQHCRRLAADALGLSKGATVVDLGCGTGLNFGLLEERVGAKGRLIGVDLTDAMLEQAALRVRRHGWSNVELVERRAAEFEFPLGVDGVVSSFALTLEPEYDRVFAKAAAALRPGGRFVLLDIKMPSNWLRRLAPALIWLVRPFAVSREVAARHPWEAMKRHFASMTRTEFYFGICYLAVGERRDSGGTGD